MLGWNAERQWTWRKWMSSRPVRADDHGGEAGIGDVDSPLPAAVRPAAERGRSPRADTRADHARAGPGRFQVCQTSLPESFPRARSATTARTGQRSRRGSRCRGACALSSNHRQLPRGKEAAHGLRTGFRGERGLSHGPVPLILEGASALCRTRPSPPTRPGARGA